MKKNLTKEQKIELMIKEILNGEQTPMIFDPYKIETDCMILWDRFSLGHTTELSSYPWSNDWNATRYDKDEEGNNLDTYTVAESLDRKEAMCECMVKASLKMSSVDKQQEIA